MSRGPRIINRFSRFNPRDVPSPRANGSTVSIDDLIEVDKQFTASMGTSTATVSTAKSTADILTDIKRVMDCLPPAPPKLTLWQSFIWPTGQFAKFDAPNETIFLAHPDTWADLPAESQAKLQNPFFSGTPIIDLDKDPVERERAHKIIVAKLTSDWRYPTLT